MGAFLDALQSTGQSNEAPSTSSSSANTSNSASAPSSSEYSQPELIQQLDNHLSSLEPQQQEFIAQYLTPEFATALGILFGEDTAKYFSKYADPSKTLTVVAKDSAGGMGGSAAPSQPSIGIAPGTSPTQGTPSGPMMGPVQQ